MSYIEDIKFAILRLDSASYQKLCDEFLNECGYSNIDGLGSEPGVNKTTSGTPDTYCCNDANGNYIFIEYTTQQASIYSKIESDIAKCLDEAFTHIKCDKISEIWYFHTTSNLTPEQDAELKSRCEAKGIRVPQDVAVRKDCCEVLWTDRAGKSSGMSEHPLNQAEIVSYLTQEQAQSAEWERQQGAGESPALPAASSDPGRNAAASGIGLECAESVRTHTCQQKLPAKNV